MVILVTVKCPKCSSLRLRDGRDCAPCNRARRKRWESSRPSVRKCTKCGKAHSLRHVWCGTCQAEYQRTYEAKRGRRLVENLSPIELLKKRARGAAYQAVVRGDLVKENCPCGSSQSEMHHADYEKPLEVTWLCTRCHHNLHIEVNGPFRKPTQTSELVDIRG